jgi:hypothetical protein
VRKALAGTGGRASARLLAWFSLGGATGCIAPGPVPTRTLELPVSATADPVKAHGQGLTPEQMMAGVRQNKKSLGECYAKARYEDRGLPERFRMRIGWTIASDGSVSDVHLDAGPSVRGLDDCIVKVIEKWRFPQSAAPSNILVPFRFLEPDRPPPADGGSKNAP